MTDPDPLPDSLESAIRLTRLTPWKARNEIARALAIPRARLAFALAGVAWGSGWLMYGVPIIQHHRASEMTFGAGLELRSTWRSNPLGAIHPVILSTRRAGSRLRVGSQFSMTGGTLCADESITIGDRVLVGANCTIIDTDFHPLDPQLRRSEPTNGTTAPIFIEDDVFIGMNCLILKGVRIGAGSVIAAGSVVTRAIPPGVMAGGNPARVIRERVST